MLILIASTFSVSTDYLLELDQERTLDVTGLINEQIYHVQNIIKESSLKAKETEV